MAVEIRPGEPHARGWRPLAAVCASCVAALLVMSLTWVHAQQTGGTVAIDPDDIGGVVTSAKGPEAGVWVIAETADLPTRFARIVVTDDQGRFVVPDLPRATYQVFVRGYGLVDSPRQTVKPGQRVNFKATVAPDARTAAQIYPAAWWLSLAEVPSGDLSAREVTDSIRGCLNCHQLGGKVTREILPSIMKGAATSLEAWDRRVQMGPVGPNMAANFKRLGAQRRMFADWTDRIAKGEAPKQTPPRPAGVERNIVLTWWDWGTERDGRTDSTPTDLRNQRVNANGPVYGVSQPTDLLLVLEPLEHRGRNITIPSTAPKTGASKTPSPYWGEENIWERISDPRSVAMDGQGRVWLTGRIRAASEQPAYCTSSPFGKYFPLKSGGRQVIGYDPKSQQFTHVDTCFTADHNQISRENLIFFGMTDALGWLDLNAYGKTKNPEASQGWCPAVVDTNGDGRITEWTEPNAPADPTKDRRIQFGCYSVGINPVDGSAWCSGIGTTDNKLVRIERGTSPPRSCKAEVYQPPPTVTPPAYGSGGVDVDENGVVWQNWRGSGHFSSFDRRKCKTNGPATGQSCSEGWTFYRRDGPTYQNAGTTFSDESYLTQIDTHDVLGLGRNVPLYGNVNSDSLEVFVPTTRQFVTLRVPYPMGFFSRSAVGRIDDPNGGWKGKGLWSSFSTYAAWHVEGGKGVRQKVLKFQIRPDPLAK
ncbi:MAG TPA: carboxypeptidase-like regulatory domain-containing protein [Vicinamibacterales bacterium]|nr:carboxypeptidase-like regulatory domain-containing protein [Vicinamibacterales bacterium]